MKQSNLLIHASDIRSGDTVESRCDQGHSEHTTRILVDSTVGYPIGTDYFYDVIGTDSDTGHILTLLRQDNTFYLISRKWPVKYDWDDAR